VRELFPAELRDVFQRRGVRRVAGDHTGEDLLAVPLVRYADHLHIGDLGVGVEELLDLARVDVLPASDDHVLDAADDLDVAVLAHHRQVAGVHPAPRVDRLRRLLRFVPVAEHHAVAAGAQFARLTARPGHARHRVDDLDLDVRHDAADRAGAAQAYLRSAMRKLGARTRLEAVVSARRAGLLP
jgi:hypothetical protein